MKRNSVRQATSVAFIGLAIVVMFLVLEAATHQRGVKSIGDWLIVASPVIATTICAILSLLLYPTPKTVHPGRRGSLWGSFVGANAFLILLALSLIPRTKEISQDGTAYWVYLFIPCFWIGIPALLLGALLGFGAGLIMGKK